MKLFKVASVLGALVLLAGCASNIEQLRTVEASGGTAFTQALTEEYRAFVVHEADDDSDWSGADYFARKGLAAAGGETVLPEEVANISAHAPLGGRVSAESAETLNEARGRLMAALDGGARDSNPQVAAQAQVAFDCWLHEVTEIDGWLANGALGEEHLADCRDKFAAAMEQLGPKEMMVDAVEPRTYLVLFDWDRSNIRPDGQAVIDQVLADSAAQGMDSVNISATGHADLSGSEDYNLALSLRRADAVREALIAGGVPAEAITVAGRGESEPAVPTADGVKEQANRRVEIILQ